MKEQLLTFSKFTLVGSLKLAKHCFSGICYLFFATFGIVGGAFLTPNSLWGIALVMPLFIGAATKINKLSSWFFDTITDALEKSLDRKLKNIRRKNNKNKTTNKRKGKNVNKNKNRENETKNNNLTKETNDEKNIYIKNNNNENTKMGTTSQTYNAVGKTNQGKEAYSAKNNGNIPKESHKPGVTKKH